MSKKIVSAGELTENGCVIVLHSQAVIHGQGSIFYGEKIDRLYRLDLDHVIDISDDESSGDNLEEIYMEQPKGFVAQGKENKRILLHNVEYSRILDRLMYLMSCTRLDLAYAVSKLSRYTSNASVEYWRSITRLSRYLRYIRECGLHYGRYPTVIKGYSDANWISDIKDSRSTSGYVFILGSATISWKSSKKTIIAKSTMES
ncbi:hypothetical protein OSB04_031983 [Centaurea solstitialis]|uniref:Uncharacterized protein n=1 Tax=Centaurea solstitialis TaxID=347529 RepID=A0AA38SAL8_9ASTR|nr:hypothetical protein OSB04_031983 [Centaurea solstitialis]